MSLLRVNHLHPFQGPHQRAKVEERGAPLSRAKAAMILIHGRGATAEGILGLTDEFAQPDFQYLAPQATNHAWYPYSFLEPQEKNEPGLSSGLQLIHDLIQSVADKGIPPNKVLLLGFSQGACLATEFAARHPQKLGGVIGLSGGLIGLKINKEDYIGSMQGTPVFLGCSDSDPHVPQDRLNDTEIVFERLRAKVDKRIYTGMGHTINEDEVKAIRGMMAAVLETQH